MKDIIVCEKMTLCSPKKGNRTLSKASGRRYDVTEIQKAYLAYSTWGLNP